MKYCIITLVFFFSAKCLAQRVCPCEEVAVWSFYAEEEGKYQQNILSKNFADEFETSLFNSTTLNVLIMRNQADVRALFKNIPDIDSIREESLTNKNICLVQGEITYDTSYNKFVLDVKVYTQKRIVGAKKCYFEKNTPIAKYETYTNSIVKSIFEYKFLEIKFGDCSNTEMLKIYVDNEYKGLGYPNTSKKIRIKHGVSTITFKYGTHEEMDIIDSQLYLNTPYRWNCGHRIIDTSRN